MDYRAHPQHSADGRWWWTGGEWVPAYTPDRRFWFNGSAWLMTHRSPRLRPLARIEWVIALGWLALLACSVVLTARGAASMNTGSVPHGLVLLAELAVISIPASGYIAHRCGGWWHCTLVTVFVWALLLAWYFAAVLLSPETNGAHDDNAAGAGLFILGVPALVVVAALAALGAGGSAGTRRRTRQGDQGSVVVRVDA